MGKQVRRGFALVAAMAIGVGVASAQSDHGGLYLNRDEGGTMRVFGPSNEQGSEVLMHENGAAPGNCSEGSFYQSSDNFIYACGSEDRLGVSPFEEGAMMPSGQPYPAGSQMLLGAGGAISSGTDASDTTSPANPQGAASASGTDATGGGNTQQNSGSTDASTGSGTSSAGSAGNDQGSGGSDGSTGQ